MNKLECGLFQFDPLNFTYNPENALSMALACDLAYHNNEADIIHQVQSWGYPSHGVLRGISPDGRQDTHAYVMGNEKVVIVAFRGTHEGTDWLTNLDFNCIDSNCGEVHNGFCAALESIFEKIEITISTFLNKNQFIWFTGHSLGGALATLAVARFRKQDLPVTGLYTFGSPRVGKSDFGKGFNQYGFEKRTFRIVNGNDLVPRVPPSINGYHHVGTVVFFDASGKPQIDPNAWIQFKETVKVDFNADILDRKLTWIEHHLLSGEHGYINMLKQNLL